MIGQTVSLLASIKVGNTPDTPSPSGTVNRVVKGLPSTNYIGKISLFLSLQISSFLEGDGRQVPGFLKSKMGNSVDFTENKPITQQKLLIIRGLDCSWFSGHTYSWI